MQPLPTLASIQTYVTEHYGRRQTAVLAEELWETMQTCGFGGVLRALREARAEVQRWREGQ